MSFQRQLVPMNGTKAALAPESTGTICTIVRLAVLTICLYGVCAHADQLVWQSGFENGFPGGEWLDWNDGSYSPSGSMPTNRTSAWTIVSRQSGEPVLAGNHAYKGWITGPAHDSHRAYPGLLADIPTPLVNTFMVYLVTDYDQMSQSDWISLGTWGNYDPATKTGKWALHTLAVRNRKLEFAHTSPFSGEYIGPRKQPDFPLRRWVRFTVYIIYQGTTGFVQVWQDGIPMLRAHVSELAAYAGTRLRSAHWGMYASHATDQGVLYNDDIRICTLSKPLSDFVSEPRCPPSSTFPVKKRSR
jgi:hypothetical protein